MKIARSVEQCIAILLLLSENQDEALSTNMIFNAIGGSKSYLQKVIRRLVENGLLTSSVGQFGGFKLAKSLDEVTVYDVVMAIDGGEINTASEMTVVTNDPNTCHVSLIPLLKKADQAYTKILNYVSIYDLGAQIGIYPSQECEPTTGSVLKVRGKIVGTKSIG